jgi:hypothetical protein
LIKNSNCKLEAGIFISESEFQRLKEGRVGKGKRKKYP